MDENESLRSSSGQLATSSPAKSKEIRTLEKKKYRRDRNIKFPGGEFGPPSTKHTANGCPGVGRINNLLNLTSVSFSRHSEQHYNNLANFFHGGI